jgi:hypothetical protein
MSDLEKVKSLALDLSSAFPRSPRETLGGYVIAGRTLDKCRAELAGTLGEYHFDCPLDNVFFDFAGITADQFRAVVASGASDEEIAEWIEENANQSDRHDVIRWNNELRATRPCDMPIELQEFLEGYIPENIPAGKIVYVWFDVYDLEEGRI